MERVVKRVREMCIHCDKEVTLEIKERETKGLIKGKEVTYKEEYTYCPHCKESWYTKNQWNTSLANAKVANK